MIHLAQVTKTFPTGSSALEEVTLSVDKGEFVFLVGPSGSGKTTLLRLLIRQILPSKGTITINDVDIVRLPHKKVPQLRKRIGIVFQDLKMLMDRTIFENVLLPLEMSNMKDKEAKEKVEKILEDVGIAEHMHKFPIQLSGGELQRAAIARALVFSPDIIIADEPTGNLDNTTSWEIVKILQDINKAGTTVLMATHNIDIVESLGKRKVVLEKGKIIHDSKKTSKNESSQSVSHDDADGEKEEQKETKNESKSDEHKKAPEPVMEADNKHTDGGKEEHESN